jgi:hypothetical protein
VKNILKIGTKPEKDSSEFESYVCNKRKAIRKALLARMVQHIEKGEFTNLAVNPANFHTDLRNNQTNEDRSYMQISEMEVSSPNAW